MGPNRELLGDKSQDNFGWRKAIGIRAPSIEWLTPEEGRTPCRRSRLMEDG